MRLELPSLCPGCASRRATMNAAPCDLCGRVNPVTAPRPREKMHFSAKLLRALLRPLGVFNWVLTALFVGFAVWPMLFRGITELDWAFLALLGLGLAVCGAWVFRLVVRGLVWVFAPATRAQKRPGGQTFLVLPVCLAVLWGLYQFDVPLRVGFALTRPAWEFARNGLAIPGAWPYRVRGRNNGRMGKSVRFEVTDDIFIWSGRRAGFAYCPRGYKAAKFPPLWMRTFNGTRTLDLGGDWVWWEESGSDD